MEFKDIYSKAYDAYYYQDPEEMIDVGGVVGSYNNYSEIFSLLTMNRILMLAEVTNMAIGLTILGELVVGFDQYLIRDMFFREPYAGLIFGTRNAPAVLNYVIALQTDTEQPLFEVDFDQGTFTYSETILIGTLPPVGLGQGVGVMLFDAGPSLVADDTFLQAFFGQSTPFLAVTSGDESMIVLNGIFDVTPNSLAFESRSIFFLPYLEEFVNSIFIP
jgi:hypothetical protein